MTTAERLTAVAENVAKVYDAGKAAGGMIPSVEEKDVNFYDYDGTLLYSYTLAEAQALTELPPLPKRKGLICQEWNWDLADIKAHNRRLTIGANYVTDDGKTRIYMTLDSPYVLDVSVVIKQTVANGVVVDWGDGTNGEQIATAGIVTFTHVYPETGRYMITLTVASGTFSFGDGNRQGCIIVSGLNNLATTKVEVGVGCTAIEYNSFHASNTQTITIPKDVKIGAVAFSFSMLRSAVIPKGTVSAFNMFANARSLSLCATPVSFGTASNLFYGCTSLRSANIPDGTTAIADYCFNEAYGLGSVIVIPETVETISSMAFAHANRVICYKLMRPNPPTLANVSAFLNIESKCVIEVPKGSLNAYQTATNWATYAGRMREVAE